MNTENRVSQHSLYVAALYVGNAAALGGYKSSKIQENWKNIGKRSKILGPRQKWKVTAMP